MSFILFAGLLMAPTPTASTVVVIDAASRLPLAGVNVRNLEALPSASPYLTDGAGHFTHFGTALHVQLSRLGYASQLVNRALKPGTVPDTVFLQPQSIALGEVAVRPGKALVLSSTPEKGSRMSRRLLPGQSVAVLVAPAAGQTCQLDMVRFFLTAKTNEGRIRVRLVNAVAGTAEGSLQPGSTDLLPAPVLVSNEQLHAAPRGRVVLDLSGFGLSLPAAGVFVVLESLPTNPVDKPIAVTMPPNGKGSAMMVLAPNPDDLTTSHTIDIDEFPQLDGMQSLGTPTWSRSTSKPEWRKIGGASSNVHVELGVLAE